MNGCCGLLAAVEDAPNSPPPAARAGAAAGVAPNAGTAVFVAAGAPNKPNVAAPPKVTAGAPTT